MPARIRDEDFEDHFWSRVDKTDTCWLWTGSTTNGYGYIRRRPFVYIASRLAYEFANGPIPEGLWVLHRCDNPPCVNPAHLFLGTTRDNNADKVAKSRGRRIGTNGAKLTESQVRQARLLYAGGLTQREIGERFGVSQTAISQLIRGEHFSYVE